METLQPTETLAVTAMTAVMQQFETAGLTISPVEKQKTIAASSDLAREFDLCDDFFVDPVKPLLLAAIAYDYAQNRDNLEKLDVGQATAYKEFIAHCVVMVAGKDSPYDHINETEVKADNMPLDDYLKLVDSLTDREATETFVNNLLNLSDYIDLNKNLGSNDGGMRVNYRVVDFCTPHGRANNLVTYDDETQSRHQANLNAFLAEVEVEDYVYQDSWFQMYENDAVICVSRATADVVANIATPGYREALSKEDLFAAELVLENLLALYVATQNNLLINGRAHPNFGFELIRERYFTNSVFSYELAVHEMLTNFVTGNSWKNKFEEANTPKKQVSPQSFIMKFGAQHGLEALLEGMLTEPNIDTDDRQFVSESRYEVNRYLGGLNGIQERFAKRLDKKEGDGFVDHMLNGFAEFHKDRMKTFQKLGGSLPMLKRAIEHAGTNNDQ